MQLAQETVEVCGIQPLMMYTVLQKNCATFWLCHAQTALRKNK